eukprot:339801_1
MTLFLLTIIAIIKYSQSITNSSGQYITISSIENNESNSITCVHPILCYAHCVGANLTMKMHSEQVIINCIHCDYLNVYAENATDFTMQYNSSNGGEIHINNAKNVFIDYNSVKNAVVYAQYAEHFNFNASSNRYDPKNDYNVFYLDYVSKEINFYISARPSRLSFQHNTIVASNAYQINFYGGNDYISTHDNIIYCPYNHSGACNFYGRASLYNWEIFIRSPTLHADMFTFTSAINNIKLWCNINDDGIYQSYTNIFYDPRLSARVCSNITSECCFITVPATNEIFCPDNSDDICWIDCSHNKLECNNTNIYPTNSTKYMHVICNNQFGCLNTYIYCPLSLDSTCQISCVDDETACYQIVIRFHVNNKHMILNAMNCRFCQGIQVFVDGNPNININHSSLSSDTHTSNATIICNSSLCYNMGITLNAPINNLHIICTGDYGFMDLDISAEMAENILFYCNCRNSNVNLKGKTDSVDSITLIECSHINIFSALEYKLDYLFIQGGNNSMSDSKTLCSYSEQVSTMSINRMGNPDCTDNVFCCPFSNVFEQQIYCNNTQNCSITLETNQKPIIIYANTAN